MKILYALYQICFALPLLLVLTILTAIVTTIGSLLGGAHIWGYYPGKVWSQLICILLLIPVKVVGREHVHRRTSYVFVPNHQGAFDIFLIYGYLGRNFKWMMKKSLRKIPFVGKACESAGHIFVDRSNPKGIRATMQQAQASLVDGVSLVVFPEGRRSYTGRLGDFKRGAFLLADDLQLPVVPVTITGSFQILPRTGKWIHWHPMTLTIHPPIFPQGQGADNVKVTMEEARRAVESGLPEQYR
ncbi:MAG: 1-acyl-sn-glycerol-3-phosphate acyltransferase [Bacteroides sp.]|nr:1-acyl-sn-glycerol-3-phosphate acyltransferase [Bacteroides sp.]